MTRRYGLGDSRIVNIAVMIPARFGSSRFPGKPMATVAGKTVLERTYAIARAAQHVDRTFIITDDERIAAHARGLGAQVVMTPSECATGTDRVAAALERLSDKPDAVINLQGDALLTPPWVIEALALTLRQDSRVHMATAAVQLDDARYAAFRQFKEDHPSSGTTVVMNRFQDALYFSKAVLPQLRNSKDALPPVYRHIGIYAYTAERVLALARLPQSSLEKAEGLEQLRALENGFSIRVVTVDYRGRTHGSIDDPADVAQAEAIIAREGELVSR